MGGSGSETASIHARRSPLDGKIVTLPLVIGDAGKTRVECFRGACHERALRHGKR